MLCFRKYDYTKITAHRSIHIHSTVCVNVQWQFVKGCRVSQGSIENTAAARLTRDGDGFMGMEQKLQMREEVNQMASGLLLSRGMWSAVSHNCFERAKVCVWGLSLQSQHESRIK
jgi:hypothetical protein